MLKSVFTGLLTHELALLDFSQAKVSKEFKTTVGTPYQVDDHISSIISAKAMK